MAEDPKRPPARSGARPAPPAGAAKDAATGRPPPPEPKRGGAVADELRAKIDAGETADKVAYPDPAAAPLGTDAEAAGTPTDPAALRRAAAKETARTPLAQDRPDPDRMQAESSRNRLIALLALVGILVLVVLIWGG